METTTDRYYTKNILNAGFQWLPSKKIIKILKPAELIVILT
jgi:hypothetical protein